MAGESAEVGSILGYLKLDRSDWDAELNAAGRKADELARHDPKIHISTNAPTALAQLAAVAAATRKLQDAQGAENVAVAKLTELRDKGNASAGQLAAAEERVEKARRGTAAATIALAAAHDKNNTAVARAVAETDALARSTDKTTASFKMGLIPALLAIAPAAVPIAGVAGGALLGLIPVAATVMLGVRGISDEMKSGALQGTKYGDDIKTLSDEFANLKQIAAGGILQGVDKGLAASKGLFAEINGDIGDMSNQLGQIIAGAGPALLQILTALNPLFVTFGQLVSNGAAHLEHWAQSSTGVQSFVSYVQAELPDVMRILGEVIVLFSHLAQGAAPFGGVLLADINAFVGALDRIPVDVLRTAIPLAVSLYVAMKAYAVLSLIINGVSTAIRGMGSAYTQLAAIGNGTMAEQRANSLALQATAAEEAVAVAEAKALEAEAAAESAQEIALAARATNSVLAEGADAAALSAIEFSAAMRAEADAAVASAATIRAESTAAAETVVAEGEVASAGWASMLGPLGAVVIGVGLLSTMFLTNKKDAQQAADAANSYAQSVKTSTDALSLQNIQQTNTNLSKKGALSLLSQLKSANDGLSVSQSDLAIAVNGSAKQYDGLAAKLKAVAAANQTYSEQQSGAGYTLVANGYNAQGKAANKLLGIIKTLRGGLQDQIVTQKQLNSLNAASAGITDKQAVAAAKLYGLTGTDGVAAYLAAKQAAKQNTDQAKQQTLQFQLENDAASLLAQTLDKLAGKNLGYAQAQNSFDSSLSNMGTHVTAAGKQITFTTNSIRNMSAASVALRGQLISQVTGAEQTAEAYGKLKGSSEAGRQKLIELRKEILNNAVAHGVDRKAAASFIDTILKIPKKVPPTHLDIEKQQADAKIAAFQKQIDAIKQGKIPALTANSKAGQDVIRYFQAQIDAIKQGKKPPVNVDVDKGLAAIRTMQGQINAIKQGDVPGVTADTLDGMRKIRSLQSAINRVKQQVVPQIDVNTTVALSKIDALRGKVSYFKNFSNAELYAAFPHSAAGGPVTGPGAKGVDSRPYLLAPGEWVVNDRAVDALRAAYGSGVMALINQGRLPSGAAAAPAASAPAPVASDRAPVVQNFYPQQSMDANAVGAASARWFQTAVR